MKILHTSDWHVGKVLKGRYRVNKVIGESALATVFYTVRDRRTE